MYVALDTGTYNSFYCFAFDATRNLFPRNPQMKRSLYKIILAHSGKTCGINGFMPCVLPLTHTNSGSFDLIFSV